ncbi:MAG: hypothetical protein AB7U81_01035 [Thiohalomonadaceae bacterium]
MNTKRYQVVYTGRCVSGMDASTVVSNLVLDVGVSEEKARTLLQMQHAVLKRFALASDAQKMVTKLERAGLVCAIIDAAPNGNENGVSGESVLVSFLSKFSPLKKK